MFKSLKEKLSNWIKKNEEKEEAIPKKPKKEKKENSKDKVQKKEQKKVAKQKEPKVQKVKKPLTEEKFDDMFEELELILLQNNVAYAAIDLIRKSLKEKLVGNSLKDLNLTNELKNSLKEVLIDSPDFLKTIKDSLKQKSPFIILFAGINGAGKTTSIAKIASLLQKNKILVCLAAADTFRAAAIQQLEVHASKLKVPIIKKDYGADPASVGFDAISYAKKNKIEVVLIDTAGRIQNKDTLMKEIEKISRVTKPDMKIFLGESITGNDATEQAKAFNESLNITGIILSKADVDEKGGTAISVSAVTGKPILFLGTGQKYGDLEIFAKEKLIEKLGI